jgi:hypothetical protein
MVVVPAAIAVADPDALPMVAAVVLLLLQVPPLPVVVYIVVAPAHRLAAPLMVPASGSGLTVTAFVVLTVPQLLLTV